MLWNVLFELKHLGRGLRDAYRQVWRLFCLFCLPVSPALAT